jgi:pyruvate dehydrogenase E1 component alpha subunit
LSLHPLSSSNLKNPISSTPSIEVEELRTNGSRLLHCYEQMFLIRRFEQKAGQLYTMKEIGGFCHLYIGQEAVVVGAQLAMAPQDTVITSYRDHGHMLACGMDAKGVMAELTGRATGYSKGKGGSMHMFSKEKKFFGGHGIVGAQVSIGTGIAFAHHYTQDGGVCITYMGDGAINQGQVYESFNMASLWGLPIVYIIEDNEYAMGTSTARSSANNDFTLRGIPYNIPGYIVNGMDLFDMYNQMVFALNHARNSQGPVLLHVKTYRYQGHSMSDPGRYRSKDEVQLMRTNHDPIENLGRYLIENHLASNEEIEGIEQKVKDQVQEAVDFSLRSPLPNEEELYTDILL